MKKHLATEDIALCDNATDEVLQTNIAPRLVEFLDF